MQQLRCSGLKRGWIQLLQPLIDFLRVHSKAFSGACSRLGIHTQTLIYSDTLAILLTCAQCLSRARRAV